jgi:hypothetical protein
MVAFENLVLIGYRSIIVLQQDGGPDASVARWVVRKVQSTMYKGKGSDDDTPSAGSGADSGAFHPYVASELPHGSRAIAERKDNRHCHSPR